MLADLLPKPLQLLLELRAPQALRLRRALQPFELGTTAPQASHGEATGSQQRANEGEIPFISMDFHPFRSQKRMKLSRTAPKTASKPTPPRSRSSKRSLRRRCDESRSSSFCSFIWSSRRNGSSRSCHCRSSSRRACGRIERRSKAKVYTTHATYIGLISKLKKII